MSENKRKYHHNSKPRSPDPVAEKDLAGNGRRGQTGRSGKASIDRYMEALRKGVTLSQ
jgi:hypothetical protein